MTQPTPPPRDARRGIALVIVLSLMAALMILAVGFAVSMRTEHKAAKMSGLQIQSVEMCYYGLAQALDHIEHDATNSTWWPATAGTPPGGSIGEGWVYPGWSNHCIHSGMLYIPTATNRATWFPNARAVNFTPQGVYGPSGLLHRVNNETNPHICSAPVRFIDVRAPDTGRMVGRYSYIVIDTTGMIDANGNHELDHEVGRAAPRQLGTNVCEIAYTNFLMTEMRAGSESNLHNGRVGLNSIRHQAFGRAESTEDLRTVGYAGYATGANPMNWTLPRHFNTYSRYPDGFPVGFAGGPLMLSTNLAGTAAHVRDNAAEVATRLSAAMPFQLPAGQFDMLTANIIDYMDTDFVPGGIDNGGAQFKGPNADSFCTEPVPMMSRLDIMTSYPTPSNLNVTVFVETFFPFLSNSVATPPPLQLKLKYELVGGTFSPGTFNAASNVASTAYGWVRSAAATPGAEQFSYPLGVGGVTSEYRSASPIPVPPSGIRITELSITKANDDTVVDRIRPPIDLSSSDILPPSNLETNRYVRKWYAIDPRINWNLTVAAAVGGQWTNVGKVQSNRLGDNRQRLLYSQPYEKGEWVAYVGNKDRLVALGELGYLLHRADRPWRTLSFFTNPTNTTLDVADYINPWSQFRLVYPTRYGLINPSTRFTNVLAQAFNRCPLELAPGISASYPGDFTTLWPSGALWIASEIINNRPGQGYTNLTALGGSVSNFFGVPGLYSLAEYGVTRSSSWIAREGILRNTEGLLGTRNNTFIIHIFAEGRTLLMDPESSQPVSRRTGEQRAVALVWRDPFAQQSPKYFVRWIRWLDDWVGDISDQF